ncbi:MAG TPA: hypothetical protein VF710_03375 [Longimicrobium sp.]
MVAITALQGLTYVSSGERVDQELTLALTADADDFLNFSEPGTVLLREALTRLAEDPNRAVDPWEIASPIGKTGEDGHRYLQFTSEFWTGGTLDLVAAHALNHVVEAGARGFQGLAAAAWTRGPEGRLEPSSDFSLRAFVNRAFRHARDVSERVAGGGLHTWEEKQRLFALVDEDSHAARVIRWLRSAAALPLRSPTDLVTQLILDWRPGGSPAFA